MITHEHHRLEPSPELPFHNLIYSAYTLDFIAQQKAICLHQKVAIVLKTALISGLRRMTPYDFFAKRSASHIHIFICIWNNSICKPPNHIRVPYSFQFITRVLDGLLFLCINKQELWRGNLRPSAQHRYHSKSFTQVSDFPPHLLGENIPAFIKEVGVVFFSKVQKQQKQ